METGRPNVVLIMSDQHNPHVAGYAGHDIVRTPNLDRLAARGTSYPSAYCTSPICVPSRASIATGRYVYETGTWDNAAPYTGQPRSWGHELLEAGYRVSTIGKLHFRDSADDTGYPDQRLSMHVHRGGDLKGVALRPERLSPPPGKGLDNLLNAGPGESDYTRYDRRVAQEAVDYIHNAPDSQPWALTVSFVAPHFPLIAPPEFFDAYNDAELPPPDQNSSGWDHPAVEIFRSAFGLVRELTPSEHRTALQAYYGLVSFLDDNIGRVLDALAASGHDDDTIVVYTSDHGESAGAHGLWFKHLMNEESVGVPLILTGPDVPASKEVDSPVSQVDLYPTLVEAAGGNLSDDLSGRSLLDPDPARSVLAEYHANGSIDASFMVRTGRLKYIHYVGQRPQMFDLDADPDEREDLGASEAHRKDRESMHDQLLSFCDPVAVNEAAKADQQRRVEAIGGVEAASQVKIPFTPVPEDVRNSG